MENIRGIDIKGKHVVVTIKKSSRPDPEDAVFFCTFGFGCSPDPMNAGSKVFGYFLTEGMDTCIRRSGVIRLASEEEVEKAKAKAARLKITIPPIREGEPCKHLAAVTAEVRP